MSRDGVAGLVCLAGALGMLWLTRGLQHSSLVPIGPEFYPRILLVITALLAAALLLTDLFRRERPARAPANYRLVVLTFAIFTAYVAALPALGYRFGTFLFVGVLQAVLEPPQGRRWALVVVVALVTTLATYYLFERYLSVLLPRGRLTGF
jgi:hypothetical protein